MTDSVAKYPDLIIRKEKPFNAEPPAELLRQDFVTPTELFFIRNHAPVPSIDPDRYCLSVGGMVKNPLRLSLAQLRGDFTHHSLTATLQCAGNRREELIDVESIEGVPWNLAAIGNAVWGGVLLRHVLTTAAIEDEARHVAFTGLDEVEKGGERFGFGGSIPLKKAMGSEVLLAFEMNGEPLPAEHGFPLRALVPGYIGARSVKWLGEIRAQAQPSRNHFQARAYKLFPPDVRKEKADWRRGLMLGELSVNAVICHPQEGERLSASPVQVQGYAMAGGERGVERVDLSIDGGEDWVTARLTEGMTLGRGNSGKQNWN